MVILFIVLIVIGVAGGMLISERAGDYDFITPLLGLGWTLLFVVLAIGILIGKAMF